MWLQQSFIFFHLKYSLFPRQIYGYNFCLEWKRKSTSKYCQPLNCQPPDRSSKACLGNVGSGGFSADSAGLPSGSVSSCQWAANGHCPFPSGSVYSSQWWGLCACLLLHVVIRPGRAGPHPVCLWVPNTGPAHGTQMNSSAVITVGCFNCIPTFLLDLDFYSVCIFHDPDFYRSDSSILYR